MVANCMVLTWVAGPWFIVRQGCCNRVAFSHLKAWKSAGKVSPFLIWRDTTGTPQDAIAG
jgi:hypothetical protein